MHPQRLNLRAVLSREHMHSIWMQLTEELLEPVQDPAHVADEPSSL